MVKCSHIKVLLHIYSHIINDKLAIISLGKLATKHHTQGLITVSKSHM
ncbi:Putative uncharacterized protein [Moritella viscosa]|uniref:Uncharacterized protein n=1 Tax=Moritella viscosa TaxID=80854 RepID=A0ABY1HDY4_9GAMM|nr:Putative uncharacterized protein [Moritella viscosa]SGY98748.1 Putative uncharacterized protein [Moritella viscosa]SGZ04888.1 Putative uncharacterized protein [Moritella viscosa]SHO09321.1 Putative uncharacterized protein [Moritella viscosa]SHO22365.1 Putative uncharacterized protein [Moritella viscosa]